MTWTIEAVESHIHPSILALCLCVRRRRLLLPAAGLEIFSTEKKTSGSVLEKFPASRGTKSLAVDYYILTKVRPFDNQDKLKKEGESNGKKSRRGGFSATKKKKKLLKEVSTASSRSVEASSERVDVIFLTRDPGSHSCSVLLTDPTNMRRRAARKYMLF